jgi:hypothetical protein
MAVVCLRNDLDELLTCFRYKAETDRRAVRTTNAVEPRFREVRRRTKPMGTFQDNTGMDRFLFAVFTHENKVTGRQHPLPADTEHLTLPAVWTSASRSVCWTRMLVIFRLCDFALNSSPEHFVGQADDSS